MASVVGLLFFFAQPALVCAQEYNADEDQRYSAEDPDNSGQVDITNGMAEQNGLYAIRQGRPLQGQAQLQNQQYSMSAQNNFSNGAGMPFQCGNQMSNAGGDCNQLNQMPSNQQNQSCASGMNSCANGATPPNAGLSGLLGGAITPGITKQVAGAVGAALMFNYMTQGGAQSLVNTMSARGWKGGRRTLGSGGVVYTH